MIFEPDIALPHAMSADSTFLTARIGTGLDDLTDLDIDLRRVTFHPALDKQVDKAALLEWRAELNEWAYDNGFPHKLNEERRSRWDVELGARLIADTGDLAEGEDPTIWCWLATHLLPHFVVYRWGWPEPGARDPWTRFGASDKNALLLSRQRVLAYGKELARLASEQEFQSIQYRPAFGLDRRVARVILETLVGASRDPSSNYGRQGSTRSADADDVCVELRIINSMRPFCFLSGDDISEIVLDAIDRLPQIRDPRKEVHRKAAMTSLDQASLDEQ